MNDYLDSSMVIAPKRTKARRANAEPSNQGKLRVVSGQSAQLGEPLAMRDTSHIRGLPVKTGRT